MFVVVICSLLAMLLTILETKYRCPGGMKIGFIIITIIGAIHYNYGNDYMSYYRLYNSIIVTPFDWNVIMSGILYREPGWVLLNYFFEYLGGFFVLVAILTIIQNVIIYNFIKKEVDKEWWPFSVFILLFNTSFLLMSFSMLRQYFVACVFLGMWHYIKQKKWWVSLTIIYLCSFVHESAIVLLPFSFMGYLPMRKSRFIYIAFAVLIVALWIGGNWLNVLLEETLLFSGTEDYLETYKNVDSSNYSMGLGFVLIMIPLFVGMHYLYNVKNVSENKLQLVILSLLGFAIMPLNLINPMIGRLTSYFAPFQIAAIPLSYGFIKNTNLRSILLLLLIVLTLYDYLKFFLWDPTWIKSYRTFHTIFEVIF